MQWKKTTKVHAVETISFLNRIVIVQMEKEKETTCFLFFPFSSFFSGFFILFFFYSYGMYLLNLYSYLIF